MTRIEETFDKVVASRTSAVAVASGDEAITYARLQQETRRLADRIERTLWGPGCPVGVLLDNSVRFVEAIFATWRSHNIVVPLNPLASRQTLQRIIDQVGIGVIITDRRSRAMIHDRGLAFIIVDSKRPSGELSQAAPNRVSLPGLSESHAVVFLTSGTTGISKIVALEHTAILQNLASARKSIPLFAYSTTYMAIPMFHSYGFCLQLLGTLCFGGQLYIGKGAKVSTDLTRDLLSSGCSSVFGVPALLRMLVDGIKRGRLESQAEQIRCLVSGASAMTEDLLCDLQRTFKQADICLTYGLTEGSPLVTVLPPSWVEQKRCSIGLPVDGVELKLLTADGGLTTEVGSVGEILIRGRSVIDRYLGSPEANASCFLHGFLKTGDIAAMDADGCLHFRGRLKDVVNRGGESIYPSDIEEVLTRHSQIEQAAVVACPHAILGEVPFAFVKPAAGILELNWLAIRQWCALHLSASEIPTRWQAVESFPTTATGKIRKLELAAMLRFFERRDDERTGQDIRCSIDK